jgi:hypothetical protein
MYRREIDVQVSRRDTPVKGRRRSNAATLLMHPAILTGKCAKPRPSTSRHVRFALIETLAKLRGGEYMCAKGEVAIGLGGSQWRMHIQG